MNTPSLPKEEKVADGIYITKFQNSGMVKETKDKKEENVNKYVFKSTAELINILEEVFESIIVEIRMLYNANEEMLEYDPNDYDLITAREENLEIINKKILRLKEIQQELKKFCPTNPIVTRDVFEYLQDEHSKVNSTNSNSITCEVTNMTNTVNENEENGNSILDSIDL